MSESAHNPDDYCYRHPDRLSFVLCERCARTICLECQIHVDGHVLCPDDAKQQKVSLAPVTRIAPRKRVRQPSRLLARVAPETPIVTYAILAVLVLSFLVDTFTRGLLTAHLSLFPSGSSLDVLHEPWTLLTSMLLAGGILGLLFNGYSTFILGRQLERTFGRQKFALLYVISGFGASVFAFLFDGAITSAIGAVLGLVGATVVLARRMGGNQLLLYITCAVSLLFAILFGYWQAAIGGGLAGAATAATYFFDNTARANRTRWLLVGLVVVLLVLAVLRAVVFQAG